MEAGKASGIERSGTRKRGASGEEPAVGTGAGHAFFDNEVLPIHKPQPVQLLLKRRDQCRKCSNEKPDAFDAGLDLLAACRQWKHRTEKSEATDERTTTVDACHRFLLYFARPNA